MLKVQEFQNLTGQEYVLADIACKQNKTMEKEHWNARIAAGRTVARMHRNGEDVLKNASNPIGLSAALCAHDKATKQVDSGYMVSLDAASSGLQLLSLLVSDPISFKLCGGSEDILDAYVEIYDNMHVGNTLSRGDLKKSIMTSLYGSTATPEAVFGDNIDLFYETMETMAPGAWDLNLGLQDLWEEVQGNTYDWHMPDGFYACIETQDKEKHSFTFLDERHDVVQKINARPRFHKGLGPNAIHSVDGMIVREMFRRCMFNQTKVNQILDWITDGVSSEVKDNGYSDMVRELWQAYLDSGFLSVRILDYLQPDNIRLVDSVVIAELIMTLPSKPFSLVAVHDCFRCHPNYGNDLRKQYNTILADINDSTLMTYIASQIAGKSVKAKKVGHIDRDVILNANYTLG